MPQLVCYFGDHLTGLMNLVFNHRKFQQLITQKMNLTKEEHHICFKKFIDYTQDAQLQHNMDKPM